MPAPKTLLRPVADLIRDPENARTHSPEQLEWLKGSIRRFGWTVPAMVVDATIYAGNGRHEAAEAMYAEGETLYFAPGKERGGAALPKGTMPVVDCTGWSEEECKAYALGDNQIALQAGWDADRLKSQLDSLSALDFPLEAIGFDQDALEALGAAVAAGANLNNGNPVVINDTEFTHTDQFAVIVKCADAAEQEARFNRLRDEYGVENVKVVVV